jgi:hypothetical protein
MTVTPSSGPADVTGVLESRGAVNAAALTFRLSEVRVSAKRAVKPNSHSFFTHRTSIQLSTTKRQTTTSHVIRRA